MKRYVIATIAAMFCVAGCGTPRATRPGVVDATSTSPTTSATEASYECQLRVDKAKAERLGFTFARMAGYFSVIEMSKHEYSTAYEGQEFVIGMRETPEQLRRIMDFLLKTDKGRSVRVKDLCTVHDKNK